MISSDVSYVIIGTEYYALSSLLFIMISAVLLPQLMKV